MLLPILPRFQPSHYGGFFCSAQEAWGAFSSKPQLTEQVAYVTVVGFCVALEISRVTSVVLGVEGHLQGCTGDTERTMLFHDVIWCCRL